MVLIALLKYCIAVPKVALLSYSRSHYLNVSYARSNDRRIFAIKLCMEK